MTFTQPKSDNEMRWSRYGWARLQSHRSPTCEQSARAHQDGRSIERNRSNLENKADNHARGI